MQNQPVAALRRHEHRPASCGKHIALFKAEYRKNAESLRFFAAGGCARALRYVFNNRHIQFKQTLKIRQLPQCFMQNKNTAAFAHAFFNNFGGYEPRTGRYVQNNSSCSTCSGVTRATAVAVSISPSFAMSMAIFTAADAVLLPVRV